MKIKCTVAGFVRAMLAWSIVVLLFHFLPLFLSGCGGSSLAQTEGNLLANVQKIASGYKSAVGVYAKNLSNGRTFGYHEDESFATASAFKVPVMIELFRRVSSGELKLDQRRRVPARGISRRYASGVLKMFENQPELTLRDYCRLMIIVSDDIAADTLMQFISPASVTATMKKLGFSHTRVSGNCTQMHYRMAGIESSFGSPENDELMRRLEQAGRWRIAGFADRSAAGNVTTPKEMGEIFEKLHNGQVVSAEASAQMIAILKQASDRNMIPRYLPPDTEVAHKIGATWRVKVDAGIAYLSRGPLVISIFAYFDPDEKGTRDMIAEIARALAQSAELNGAVP
jgi:beta-lactamase class A